MFNCMSAIPWEPWSDMLTTIENLVTDSFHYYDKGATGQSIVCPLKALTSFGGSQSDALAVL